MEWRMDLDRFSSPTVKNLVGHLETIRSMAMEPFIRGMET